MDQNEKIQRSMTFLVALACFHARISNGQTKAKSAEEAFGDAREFLYQADQHGLRIEDLF